MDAALAASLEAMVSPPRLRRYRQASSDDLGTVVNYLWNIQLSEAILPCIAMLEVCLRNAVHDTLTAREGTEYWFQRILQPARWNTVQRVIAELAGVSTTPPIVLPLNLPPAGKVIANLTFGFWPHIFSHSYRKLWWTPQSQPIASVLRNHTNVTASTRAELHTRLLYINQLRNRAMHHEPVFQGVSVPNMPTKSIDRLHNQIVETLSWINPDAARLLSCLNRFPSVFDPAGRIAIESAVKTEFGIV